jgi:hypothetical protein
MAASLTSAFKLNLQVKMYSKNPFSRKLYRVRLNKLAVHKRTKFHTNCLLQSSLGEIMALLVDIIQVPYSQQFNLIHHKY